MKKKAYTVDTIFVLVLFVVFSITVLFVLMSGAGVYKDTQSVMTERYEERTCLSYISAKVNHFDEKGIISVAKIGNCQALAISADDGNGVTYIYCKDGSVREILVDKSRDFNLDEGLEIVKAKSLAFSADGNLLTVTCTGDTGKSATVTLHVASGIGGIE